MCLAAAWPAWHEDLCASEERVAGWGPVRGRPPRRGRPHLPRTAASPPIGTTCARGHAELSRCGGALPQRSAGLSSAGRRVSAACVRACAPACGRCHERAACPGDPPAPPRRCSGLSLLLLSFQARDLGWWRGPRRALPDAGGAILCPTSRLLLLLGRGGRDAPCARRERCASSQGPLLISRRWSRPASTPPDGCARPRLRAPRNTDAARPQLDGSR